MVESASFDELIRRVRAGDEDAAAALVKTYESAIRRAVRFRITDARLVGLLDSMDICQSVLKSFFIRAASGQYDLKTPQQLLRLLEAMARNKLASQARRQRSVRRGGRHITSEAHDDRFIARGKSPSTEVAVRDLLQEVHRRLSADERQILDLRNEGLEWSDVAARLGSGGEGLRKKLSRALDRVAEELGLDDIS